MTMNRRGSGVLLHVTSLPSLYGIGDLGPGATAFVAFLAQTKQSYWQVLPLTPTELGLTNSPYSSSSAFAGNTLLLSPEGLMSDGLLTAEEAAPWTDLPTHHVDYPAVTARKEKLFAQAYERFKTNRHRFTHEFESFCEENSYWLSDYALFAALKSQSEGAVWSDWPEDLRDRHPAALHAAARQLHEAIEQEKFLQFMFTRQWTWLQHDCHRHSIQLIGDAPFYVSYDSADVWSHPEMFKLDQRQKPIVVAGVPPDYFSETGQRWGNPIYQWEVLRDTGYAWWIQRINHNLSLFDLVRIDHFRGFASCWEIPADEKTAIRGAWVGVPGADFFSTLWRRLPQPRLIAEDLGVITPEVRELMHQFELPGMRILLFAFDGALAEQPHAPHNYVKDCVVYTGTHDNNTVRGWFDSEASAEDRNRLFRYLGREIAAQDVAWEFIRLVMMSVASRAIIPLQDLLGLGASARMNRPATTEGNWSWRFVSDQMTPDLIQRFLAMTDMYGRA